MGQTTPQLTQIWRSPGSCRKQRGQLRPQLRPTSAERARPNWPNSGKYRPTPPKFGRMFGRARANVWPNPGQSWPKSERCWPKIGLGRNFGRVCPEMWPNPGQSWPNSANAGQHRNTLGKAGRRMVEHGAYCGPNPLNVVKPGPHFAEIGPTSGEAIQSNPIRSFWGDDVFSSSINALRDTKCQRNRMGKRQKPRRPKRASRRRSGEPPPASRTDAHGRQPGPRRGLTGSPRRRGTPRGRPKATSTAIAQIWSNPGQIWPCSEEVRSKSPKFGLSQPNDRLCR